jgi:pimeloyl-ACP methyl ester carboxylesterase
VPYLEVNGIRAHHDVAGSGPAVVFLHGGFCSAEVMRPMAAELRAYAVHSPERPGHGRTPDRPGPMSYDAGVADTLAYLDAVGLEEAHLVGYSDGAIIGLLLARDHPDRVRSLVAISANLRPDVWVPESEHAAASPADAGAVLSQEYARLSPDGPAHEEALLERLMEMWTTQPSIAPQSLAAVTAPTLVVAGDHDMVALEHTASIAAAVPGAQLCVVPGASHLLVRERPGLVGRVVREFLSAAARGVPG